MWGKVWAGLLVNSLINGGYFDRGVPCLFHRSTVCAVYNWAHFQNYPSGAWVGGSNARQCKYKIKLPTVQRIINPFISSPGISCPQPESVKLWQLNFTVLYIYNHNFFCDYLILAWPKNTHRVYL